ncbi:MAG: hypothetical protein ACPL2N_04285 [Candidatus Cryosericum sp.]
MFQTTPGFRPGVLAWIDKETYHQLIEESAQNEMAVPRRMDGSV